MRGTFAKHQLRAQPWARSLWKNKKDTVPSVSSQVGVTGPGPLIGPHVLSVVTEKGTQPEAIGESIHRRSIGAEFQRRSEDFSGSQGIAGLPGRGNSRHRGPGGGSLREPRACCVSGTAERGVSQVPFRKSSGQPRWGRVGGRVWRDGQGRAVRGQLLREGRWEEVQRRGRV